MIHAKLLLRRLAYVPWLLAVGLVLAKLTATSVTAIEMASMPKMYWAEGKTSAGYTAKIRRANLDGSNVEDFATGLDDYYSTLALDMTGGKMYWRTVSRIRRANLDGSNVEDLGTDEYYSTLALDVAGGKMYWGD